MGLKKLATSRVRKAAVSALVVQLINALGTMGVPLPEWLTPEFLNSLFMMILALAAYFVRDNLPDRVRVAENPPPRIK